MSRKLLPLILKKKKKKKTSK